MRLGKNQVAILQVLLIWRGKPVEMRAIAWACGEGDTGVSPRSTFRITMWKLCKRGFVQKSGPHPWLEYRITAEGIKALEAWEASHETG